MTALAHAGLHGDVIPPGEVWEHWALEWSAVAGLALTAVAYALLVSEARRRSGGRAVTGRHVVAFTAGLIALTAALASPLDSLTGTLLAFHMAQHVLLVAIAAPLLTYGAPPARIAVGLPPTLRAKARRGVAQLAGRHLAAVTFAAMALHAATLWIFHARAISEAALTSPALHALEHLALIATAVLFWSAVFAFGSRSRPSAATVLSLFLVGAQGAALGALMAFSATTWYPAYAIGAGMWDVSAIADQQLAGLLMWGLGGLAPVAAGAALLVAWFDRLTRYPATLAPTAREQGPDALSTRHSREGTSPEPKPHDASSPRVSSPVARTASEAPQRSPSH